LTLKLLRALLTKKSMTKSKSSKVNGRNSSLIQSKQETSYTTNKLSSKKSWLTTSELSLKTSKNSNWALICMVQMILKLLKTLRKL
jgi:hypothetical protein